LSALFTRLGFAKAPPTPWRWRRHSVFMQSQSARRGSLGHCISDTHRSKLILQESKKPYHWRYGIY
jgi:hypothetical protein